MSLGAADKSQCVHGETQYPQSSARLNAAAPKALENAIGSENIKAGKLHRG